MSGKDLVVGIHPEGAESFTARWESALRTRGVAVKLLDLLGEDPLGQVVGCDGVMWHWAQYPHERRMLALPLLRVIETHLRIPVFPDMATCWHFDDKIAQSYLLKALGIPAPKTWVFWRRADALAWCETAAYPVVAKLAVGAGSTNVALVRDVAAARSYVERCFSGSGILVRPPLPRGGIPRLLAQFKRTAKRAAQAVPYVLANHFPSMPDRTYWMPQKNYALFQEFMPGNNFDTRVTVVGNRAFAYRRFNRPNDFRASGSGNFDVDPSAIDRRCIRDAFESSRKLGSQSMAYDWLFRADGSGPVTGEISYGYVDWMIEKCPGHWDSDLNWHEGRLWPEEAHVDDFLKRIRQGAGRAP